MYKLFKKTYFLFIILLLPSVEVVGQNPYSSFIHVGYGEKNNPVFIANYLLGDERNADLVFFDEKREEIEILRESISGEMAMPMSYGTGKYISYLAMQQKPALFSVSGDTLDLAVEAISNQQAGFSLMYMQLGLGPVTIDQEGKFVYLPYTADRRLGQYDIDKKEIEDLGVTGILPKNVGDYLYFFKTRDDGKMVFYMMSLKDRTEQQTALILPKAARTEYEVVPDENEVYISYNYRYMFRYNINSGAIHKIDNKGIPFSSTYYSYRDKDFKVLYDKEGVRTASMVDDVFSFESSTIEAATQKVEKQYFRDYMSMPEFDDNYLEEVKPMLPSEAAVDKFDLLVGPLALIRPSAGFYVEKAEEYDDLIIFKVTDGTYDLMRIDVYLNEDIVSAELFIPEGQNMELKEEWTDSAVVSEITTSFSGDKSFSIVLEGDTFEGKGMPDILDVVHDFVYQAWMYKK